MGDEKIVGHCNTQKTNQCKYNYKIAKAWFSTDQYLTIYSLEIAVGVLPRLFFSWNGQVVTYLPPGSEHMPEICHH